MAQTATAKDYRLELAKLEPEFGKVLGKLIKPEHFVRVAVTAFQRTPALLDAFRENPNSVYECLMACAELQLEPNSALHHAYLIPFRLRGKQTATLIIGYRGYIELCYRSGKISKIYAEVVHEGDEFEVEKGTSPRIVHRPQKDASGKDITHVYGVARTTDGEMLFEVMSWKEVDAIRQRSKAADSGPWKTDFSEMARKTVLRRLCKKLPMSADVRRAEAIDNEQYEEAKDTTYELVQEGDPNPFEVAGETPEEGKKKSGVNGEGVALDLEAMIEDPQANLRACRDDLETALEKGQISKEWYDKLDKMLVQRSKR